MARRSARGFTLIELMIVVVIVGVLATLAVVGYRKIVQSAHVSEATSMVQNIRVAQEAYHAETQQYANISSSLTSYYPASPQYQVLSGWGGPCGNCAQNMSWSMLPLHVDGPVLFGYATITGAPNTTPAPWTVNGQTVTIGNIATEWYVVAARGDLDNDPTVDTQVFAGSFTNQVYVSNEGR